MPLAPLVLILAAASPPVADVDYARDVKPLLARHCVTCHGAERPRGNLRLDTAAGLREGGDGGPAIEPGDPEASPLIEAVTTDERALRMPLNRAPLSAEQVGVLRDWIAAGAPSPEGEVPSEVPVHWAFVAPSRPEPPAVNDESWSRTPIDRFIRAELDRRGLSPSPEADRVTLLRRASLDLIGLPPTPEEVDAFLADDSPDAYERQVDRLLASPHYGERWGRLWLDLARYADSNGYSIDAPRSIWKYRDWVVDALNRDLPYDRFIVDQLAGDLLEEATLDQRVATGFHRNTMINQEGGIDKEQFRVESVIDRANTTGTAFLGLTVGCAQCHDHKYDPISQREYYGLYAFFNDDDEPDLPVATPEEIARRDAADAEADALLAALPGRDPAIWEAVKAWEEGLGPPERQKQSQEVRTAFDTPFDRRDDAGKALVLAAYVDQAAGAKEHRAELAKIKAARPKVPTTPILRRRAEPRPTRLLMAGDFTRPGDPVEPGVPAVFPGLGVEGRATRRDLAEWIARPDHPLTSRVAVNRAWQALFGRGLVETADDFGTQGTPPSHPELLDWLATEYVRLGWSTKALHRLIVTTAVYRQSSTVGPDLASDPDNRLLARQSRLRVDAELVRDAALASSGLLSATLGGPSVHPPQPDGVMGLGQVRRDWTPNTGPDRYRRGLYTFFWRATPHPALMVFDAPEGTRTCARRSRSNTPLQALTLLNDPAFVELAVGLGDRILREDHGDDTNRLRRAFRLVLAREPTADELARLSEVLAAERADFADAPAEADRLIDAGPPGGESPAVPAAERAAWAATARVLLNLDEFITRE